MNLTTLNPWQQLLWLVAFIMVIAPVVVFWITTTIRAYYRAKENHVGRIAQAIGNVLKQAGEGPLKKMQEEMEKVKKSAENDV